MKVEVGKSYLNRNGDILTIVKEEADPIDYWFRCDHDRSYTKCGHYWADLDDDEYDLVELLPSEEEIKEAAKKAIDHHELANKAVRKAQIGGNHYSKLAIQPREYGKANGLDFDQINVVKYVTRFRDKDGLKDLGKAKHYINLLIEEFEEK